MSLRTIFVSLASALVILTLAGCIEPIHPYQGLAPGTWRAELYLDANKSIKPSVEDRRQRVNTASKNDEDVLPFLFDVVYTSDQDWHIEVRNGAERVKADSIRLARTRGDADKHLFIYFEAYDSHIEAIVKEGVMQGHYVVHYKDNYRIPFAATHGPANRFHEQLTTTPSDFSGQWAVTFSEEEDSYPAIGLFEQEGSMVTGTFLTETGDYRYLEGIADGDVLWLSAFDGAHAFLFRAKLQEDGSLAGLFKSGHRYSAQWRAVRDDKATLGRADTLTKQTEQPFIFTFKDADGRPQTYPRPEANRITLVQIMGTWCPNCYDESMMLKSLVNDDRYSGHIDVVGIAFERYRDEAKAQAGLQRYRDKLDLPYPLLHGGYYKKEEAAKALPMLSDVISYPTLIVLDHLGASRYIHTGFNGPATPAYDGFIEEFHGLLDDLVAEKAAD